MPTKNQVLLKFQKDLQELNASFEAEMRAIEKARLKKFWSMATSRPLVDDADTKASEADAERKADRSRATAARNKAIADATQKRRDALLASDKAWRRAEDEAERARDDKHTEESRKHEDKMEEIGAILPMYKQTALRDAENARHEKVMARIQEDFDTAWDRAREDYQNANQAALDGELRASELGNDAEQEGFAAADVEYEQTLENVRAKLHDALLKSAETRELEEGFQQQLRDTRDRWETDKAILRAEFKKNYDNAG
jgi:hypothetical protein